MVFLFQLSVILLLVAATTAERNLNSNECTTSDDTPGQCLSIIACRRRLSKNRNLKTPSVCRFRDGVPLLCCPVIGAEKSNLVKPNQVAVNQRPVNNAPTYISPSMINPSSKFGINPAGCGKTAVTSPDTGTVVGGRETKKHAWPWMAGIREKVNSDKTRFICGGSLITKRHVLTAAHCFGSGGKYRAPSDFKVVLGSHYRKSGSSSRAPAEENVIIATAKAIKIHEDFNFDEKDNDNDVAIIVLDTDVRVNAYVNPVCLPTQRNNGQDTDIVTVIGWGNTKFEGSKSETLQEASFKVIPAGICRHIFRNFQLANGITNNMLCAGVINSKKERKDACQFDSGGPLMKLNTEEYRWMQVGVVSFGKKCAAEGFPGVYMKVANFVPWIQRVVRRTSA